MPLLESPGKPRIERLLKAASRQRFTETSGIKIRAFLADAELFLTLSSRLRDRWNFVVFARLGSMEAEKVRRSHVAATVASYEKFRDGLIALFGLFEFEGAYRATLRGLRQSGYETVAAYAGRTTDLCSHAYAVFSTEAQLLLPVDHFISGLADSSSREYLQRNRLSRIARARNLIRQSLLSVAKLATSRRRVPLKEYRRADATRVVASGI